MRVEGKEYHRFCYYPASGCFNWETMTSAPEAYKWQKDLWAHYPGSASRNTILEESQTGWISHRPWEVKIRKETDTSQSNTVTIQFSIIQQHGPGGSDDHPGSGRQIQIN
jgi:hypothetical protein